MNNFLEYIVELNKSMEAGIIPDFPDPGDPADIGDPLTQDDIDFIKRLRKEVEERFGGGV